VLLCQLFLGLPLFLEPYGFHIRAALQGSRSFFRNMWPVHLNLRRLISILMFSWLVSFQSFSLEMTLGHQILQMYLRHRLMKDCNFPQEGFRFQKKFVIYIHTRMLTYIIHTYTHTYVHTYTHTHTVSQKYIHNSNAHYSRINRDCSDVLE
jgi:hypothetical protein